MKIYSYISALLIAGIASFSSCSQEEDVKEMNGDNSSSGLQISVSDGWIFRMEGLQFRGSATGEDLCAG